METLCGYNDSRGNAVRFFEDDTISVTVTSGPKGHKDNTSVDKVLVFGSPHLPNPGKNESVYSMVNNDESNQDLGACAAVLKDINRILMEEDIEDDLCLSRDSSLSLQEAEKSFYEALGKDYPPPSQSELTAFTCHSSSSNGHGNISHLSQGLSRYRPCHQQTVAGSSYAMSYPFSSLRSTSANDVSRLVSPENRRGHPSVSFSAYYTQKFKRGAEEANMLLPNASDLFVSPVSSLSFFEVSNSETETAEGASVKNTNVCCGNWSGGRKNQGSDDVDVESRTKQMAASSEVLLSTEFSKMMLFVGESDESTFRDALHDRERTNTEPSSQVKGPNGGRRHHPKRSAQGDVVDLKHLLVICSQAVAADNRMIAEDLLKKIRKHSSRNGNGLQRMASYFADALVARFTGTAKESYGLLLSRPMAVLDNLKAYHLIVSVAPVLSLFYFFSNKSIMRASKSGSTLHIVDFGTNYGFQWPSFMKQLSSAPDGPSKLRITAIELPQPGKRPAERIKQTGDRLSGYARSFNVPFEFNYVAQKWETISVEDIKVESDEVLVVNSHLRFRYLLDETVVSESPRDKVLNLIRSLNPKIFIHVCVNGTHGVPFFLSRFKEAIHYFSCVFDMYENTMPEESGARMLCEEVFGREVMNVIACEGPDRIERPEAYKQWQVRNQRAGFRLLPLDEKLFQIGKAWAATVHHKDHVVERDGHWLLQGWKGRITGCLSCWEPAH